MAEGPITDGGLGSDVVPVAFAQDVNEAEMIRGLLEVGGIPSYLRSVGIDGPAVGIGLMAHGAKQVLVRRIDAEAATRLLSESTVEEGEPGWETANAKYLDEAQGRGPRNYGIVGAYARIWLCSFGAMALAFAIFLLLRAT